LLILFEGFNTHLTPNNSVYGLELCPKCKKGHLYPLVTGTDSAGPKDQFREAGIIREYGCDICGYKQKGVKQTQIKNKLSATLKKQNQKQNQNQK
jgi:hypothetical protein